MLSHRSFLVSLSSRKRKRRRKKKKNDIAKTSRKKLNCRTQSSFSKIAESQDPNLQNEIDEGFQLESSALSQTNGVQPLGNLYLNSSSLNIRNTGLGNLQILTDEILLDILGFLEGEELGVLSAVSKSFYIFTNHDSVWRNLVLGILKGEFFFAGSWKSTFIQSKYSPSDLPGPALRVGDFYSDYLFQSWLCANLEMKPDWVERDNIARKRGMSIDEFTLNFEEVNKPVLLQGCIDNWPALQKWNRDYLIGACRDARFSVGSVEMKLEEFFRYSDLAREERPLYLFDSKFADKVPTLGSDYEVPPYFREDLFSVLGKEERPDYRWVIIGPARSGSSFHIDPNSTSAWNAVIRGSKKWVMFPPDVVPPGVHPSPDGSEVASPVSIVEWFMNFYESSRCWSKKPIECVCKAGEVIFVPHGWWHLVINLEESFAITQNFVSRSNLLNVLDFLKRPNASDLVSGTRDRVNLHWKFMGAIDASLPGTIEVLMKEAEEKKKAKKTTLSFWDSVVDSHAGEFKFCF